MLQMIAKKIAYCCCKNEEEQEIVQYGLELILENIGKAVGIIGVALFTGYVYQVIIAAIVFMSLRSMAGGIHCKTSLGCFLAMLLVIGISVGCCHLIVPIWIYIFGTIFIELLFYQYAPCDTSNNPILDERIRNKKKIGAMLLGGILLFAIISVDNLEIKNIVFVSMVLEGITIRYMGQ